VSPESVETGSLILVRPGEKLPLDGMVVSGSSQLDTAALTGEALPRDVAAGDGIVSGSVNLSGLLRIRVSKPFGESTVARILELIESAGDKKARVENFITRFARYYTPAVLGIAAVLALAPPLLLSLPWRAWMERGLIFLVVSCPCALVISVPLSFFGGIGSASRRGILVKGSNYLELLANVGTVVFDKTGTLTQGTFSVTAVHPQGLSEARLLELAAHAESFSSHPISLSVRAAYPGVIDRGRVSNVAEHAGHGVTAAVDGLPVAVGNAKLMAQVGVACRECRLSGTAVHLAADGAYGGHIVLADTLKPDARAAITALRALGVRKTVLLTGDKDAVARETADALGVDTYHAGLLPQDKVALVERMLDEMPNNAPLAFVGDGINDAPVLARADVGIAMGAMGSDAAIEAADIVLMDDKPSNIPVAVRIARKTRSIVRQNIVLALGIKFLVLALAAFGASTMWQAVFADVGVAVIAILNAMRALRIDNG
ncbi:MAG: cadmium-translocating P-type ATPase, partial [Clostridiales bacterium]|nr:cadmium-translocating P-type ATPase [Clostridiales bacterium]